MKRLILSIIALLVLVLGCISCEPVEAPPPSATQEEPLAPASAIEAQVVRIIDGDTIEVDIAGTLYKVRYIGIDTPETDELMFAEATAKNAELVEGKVVRLEKDVSETDKYGRLLRYMWVDGNMVNATLVAMGYAQVATYPPDVKYQQDFLELQRRAQEAGMGLWASPQPVPTAEGVYVGSINSDVYHYPTCTYAQRIYPENQIWFSSPADARARGYRPCKVCRPP